VQIISSGNFGTSALKRFHLNFYENWSRQWGYPSIDSMAVVIKAEYRLEPKDTSHGTKEIALKIIILLDRHQRPGQKVDQKKNGIIFVGHVYAATATS